MRPTSGHQPVTSETPIVDLDHAATTRVRPEVSAAMEPFDSARYGNPSGSHLLARDAVRAIDEAREQIAEIVGCAPGDVVFTSGGTESDNHAITGGLPPRPGVPLCSAVEHHGVLDAVRALDGWVVDVDTQGRVDIEQLGLTLDRLGERTSVVSVMLANNEIGVVNDLSAVAACIADHSSQVPHLPLHTDAVQAAAWMDLRTAAVDADLISISAHKLGGPKGIGALVVRKPTTIRAMILGGGQERNRRSGTPDVAGIVGFATALRLTDAERSTTNRRVHRLRQTLMEALTERLSGLVFTVPMNCDGPVLPGICHVCIEEVDSESMLFLLEMGGVMSSAGSSCASGAQESSHVLAAIGVKPDLAKGALRLSLGRDSTDAHVEHAVNVISAAVDRVRTFAG